ncbi:SGNH/GDSL hydrolase family protein [Gorillibacterium timonense]|uniref:SGNH/GDSL hydrolase family protein n=1 Tax=Gorillibacterium timonense TaxID=1689269 RepID=UPI00071C8B6D|nr:SGNH/GDSL hydrolase family protein [Gorillibacterium timonense]
MTRIKDNALVLFQGDSITDCGRNYQDPNSLGYGYALLIAAAFGRKYPEKNVRFLNRGVNGNRVTDLYERWERDCTLLKPDWVSIYIGINDTWRRFDNNDPTTADEYYEGYRRLLLRTQENTEAGIILVEPFVLPVPEDRKTWREDLDPKIQAVRELAREFHTPYVALDGRFAAVSTETDPAFWAGDGVHPSPAGHAIIAEAWLEAMKA